MQIEKAFGLALRNLRKERKLSQEQLAEFCGLHRTYISLLERGLKSPSLSTLFRISNTLAISPHQLVFSTEQEIEKVKNQKDLIRS